MRDIKRDSSTFRKFKDEKQWNEWYNKTKAQTRSQFLDDIFDIDYTSGLIDDTHLFDLNKLCIYAVFTNTILKDTGKIPRQTT